MAWQVGQKTKQGRRKMKRRQFLGAAGLAVIPRFGHAQAFPERPVRFVVPYAPGGSTDTSLTHHRRAAVGPVRPAGDRRQQAGRRHHHRHRDRRQGQARRPHDPADAGRARRERGLRHHPALRLVQGPGAGRPLRRPAAAAGGQQRRAVQVGGRASGLVEEPAAPFPTPRPASARSRICGASTSRRAPACRSSMSATRAAPRRCAT